MSGERDLLVYEYFQTDVVGHRGTLEDSIRVLSALNRFLAAAIQRLDPAADTFILSSDHGNVEDMRTRWHTNNPVPILLWGRGAARLGAIRRKSHHLRCGARNSPISSLPVTN